MTKLEQAIVRVERARLAYSKHHVVKIVAVSKYASAAQIGELYAQGQRAFGENKVQDLSAKQTDLAAMPIEWHFIGNLQSNKINKLLDAEPFLLHSLSSLDLARALNARLVLRGKTLDALLQINSSREPSKGGVSPEAAREIYARIADECPALRLRGLMTIGAHTDDKRKINASFALTQRIFEDLKPLGASVLSMGMSGDFEAAIMHGANLLRLGSVLFGES
ncbi:MAG: YggS family pyridoxal phosphate-dependent enzyme [Helicobacteraceae bacterium]